MDMGQSVRKERIFINIFWQENNIFFSVREVGGEAEVGEPVAGQAAKGHCPGVSRGLCPLHHGQEARHVRPLQPRPEGQDAQDRLPQAGGQG